MGAVAMRGEPWGSLKLADGSLALFLTLTRSLFAPQSRVQLGNAFAGWTMLGAFIQRYRMQLGLCLRVTVAALSALALGRVLGSPMVLWAVLTAVILTQMSVGKSVKATIDYSLGTLGGAIYAGLIAAFVPRLNDAALAAILAIAIAPVALLAAISPRFAAAPSSAAIVVLAPALTHATSLASATDRVVEVALGGSVALVVSLMVLPTRARELLMRS